MFIGDSSIVASLLSVALRPAYLEELAFQGAGSLSAHLWVVSL
jgi:hypothetical protein